MSWDALNPNPTPFRENTYESPEPPAAVEVVIISFCMI